MLFLLECLAELLLASVGHEDVRFLDIAEVHCQPLQLLQDLGQSLQKIKNLHNRKRVVVDPSEQGELLQSDWWSLVN